MCLDKNRNNISLQYSDEAAILSVLRHLLFLQPVLVLKKLTEVWMSEVWRRLTGDGQWERIWISSASSLTMFVCRTIQREPTSSQAPPTTPLGPPISSTLTLTQPADRVIDRQLVGEGLDSQAETPAQVDPAGQHVQYVNKTNIHYKYNGKLYCVHTYTCLHCMRGCLLASHFTGFGNCIILSHYNTKTIEVGEYKCKHALLDWTAW